MHIYLTSPSLLFPFGFHGPGAGKLLGALIPEWLQVGDSGPRVQPGERNNPPTPTPCLSHSPGISSFTQPSSLTSPHPSPSPHPQLEQFSISSVSFSLYKSCIFSTDILGNRVKHTFHRQIERHRKKKSLQGLTAESASIIVLKCSFFPLFFKTGPCSLVTQLVKNPPAVWETWV